MIGKVLRAHTVAVTCRGKVGGQRRRAPPILHTSKEGRRARVDVGALRGQLRKRPGDATEVCGRGSRDGRAGDEALAEPQRA